VLPVKRRKTALARREPSYEAVLADVVGLVESARSASARTVNALITATYWTIVRRIVEQEQHGATRAGYGEELIVRLSGDLQSRIPGAAKCRHIVGDLFRPDVYPVRFVSKKTGKAGYAPACANQSPRAV
jgi:hypothetical protein